MSSSTDERIRAHGTHTAYNRQRCRCDRCVAFARDYHAKRRAARAGVLAEADPRHGTRAGYTNYGCRCDRCREAQRRYLREYRQPVWSADE